MKTKKFNNVSKNINQKTFSKLFIENKTNKVILKTLNQTQLRLKTILKIIFECIKSNRKIYFIGFPDLNHINFSDLLHNSNCSNLKSKTWVNGLLSNSLHIHKYINSKKYMFKSKNKNNFFLKSFNQILNKDRIPDLIIYFNYKDNINSIEESRKLKIPSISITDNLGYLVHSPHNLKNNFIHNYIIIMFHTLFSSVLKRQNTN